MEEKEEKPAFACSYQEGMSAMICTETQLLSTKSLSQLDANIRVTESHGAPKPESGEMGIVPASEEHDSSPMSLTTSLVSHRAELKTQILGTNRTCLVDRSA